MQDSMEAVRDGLADIGVVFALFESDTMPLSNVSYYTPFASGKMAAVMDAMEALVRTNPAVRAEWERNGMTFLAPIAAETYGLWTNFPALKLADLKGHKINTPGVASKWLQGTGAVAVDGGLPTYFTNVQTGVTEGAMSFYTGILGTRLYEVAPHIADVNIGVAAFGGVAVNTQRLRNLPAPVRDAILKAGGTYKDALVKDTLGRVAAARQEMLSKGAKLVTWSEVERRAWAEAMPDIAGEWVKDNEARKLPAAGVLKQYMSSLRASGEVPLRAWGQ
jgi:TRAP-type C4-dicarboxylate transport system substrate-binding protein